MDDVLLSQCVNLVNNIVAKNMLAFINIKVGDKFSFQFNNQKKYLPMQKKKSPSQEKRNLDRTINFKRKLTINESKDGTSETETKA
jgi:hypothetical protein